MVYLWYYFVALMLVVAYVVSTNRHVAALNPLQGSNIGEQMADTYDRVSRRVSNLASTMNFAPAAFATGARQYTDSPSDSSNSDSDSAVMQKIAKYKNFRSSDSSGRQRIWCWMPTHTKEMYVESGPKLEPFNETLVPVANIGAQEWTTPALEKMLQSAQIDFRAWLPTTFENFLRQTQEEGIQLISVENRLYVCEDVVAIRIKCPEEKRYIVQSIDKNVIKFPQITRPTNDDPWSTAYTFLEKTFQVSRQTFVVSTDKELLIEEYVQTSRFPGVNMFVRRHVIDVQIVSGSAVGASSTDEWSLSRIAIPSYGSFQIKGSNCSYLWRTIADCEGIEGRHGSNLILDEGKLMHGWSSETVTSFLRRNYIDLDPLQKDPKIMIALVKDLNDSKSFFQQTSRGEIIRVVRLVYLRLWYASEVCVGLATVDNKKTHAIPADKMSFPHLYHSGSESFYCAARKCATTKLRASNQAISFTVTDGKFDDVHKFEEGIDTQTLYPMRTLCQKFVVDATVTTSPDALKSFGIKGKRTSATTGASMSLVRGSVRSAPSSAPGDKYKSSISGSERNVPHGKRSETPLVSAQTSPRSTPRTALKPAFAPKQKPQE
eukprot:GEMP01016799.1.p1 GENE.GEMP01016799.1~~GEMP01016799.1.p1  ORF type:complete len:603 (+),score=110.78 GEMP01016799.1:728-2536(+)